MRSEFAVYDRENMIALLHRRADYYRSEQYAKKMHRVEMLLKLCALCIVSAAAGLLMVAGLLLIKPEAIRNLLPIIIMCSIVATFIAFAKIQQVVQRRIQYRCKMVNTALQRIVAPN